MASNGVDCSWLMAHGSYAHWLVRSELSFSKVSLIFYCRLHPLGLYTYTYIYIYSSQRVTLGELVEWQKVLLLPPRPRSSSIHDVHFLCLHIFSLSSFFASDSIFYSSTFFSLYFGFCMLCSTEPHCVLFRLQIASSVLLLIWFLVVFFAAWIPFTLSTSYTAWCPLVGNTLSFFVFSSFYFCSTE